jgi:hypothetical protein
LSAFHSQQKAGFATQYESRVATSIQNLFPHVFGKTGSDDSQYLPGVKPPDKWNNGSHGLKHSINKGMGLVEKQVENAIHSVLSRIAPAGPTFPSSLPHHSTVRHYDTGGF